MIVMSSSPPRSGVRARNHAGHQVLWPSGTTNTVWRMRTRLISLLTALLAALAVTVPAATPASAQSSYSFDVQSAFNPNTDHKGSAHAWGTVNFIGATGFDLDIHVKDACPADGYGAYVRILYTGYMNTSGATDWNWIQNSQCSNTVYYPSTLVTTNQVASIVYLEIQVCERDHNGGNWLLGDCAVSGRKFNPYS